MLDGLGVHLAGQLFALVQRPQRWPHWIRKPWETGSRRDRREAAAQESLGDMREKGQRTGGSRRDQAAIETLV